MPELLSSEKAAYDSALQPGGTLTGAVAGSATIDGTAASTVKAGALLGASAVQPNTSPTLSGLTLTAFSGVVKAAAGVLAAAALVDADVSVIAAIAGSKINPDFGAQNILTTGYLAIGSAPALSGSIRLSNSQFAAWRNAANTADAAFIQCTAANVLVFTATAGITLSNATTCGSSFSATNVTGSTSVAAGTTAATTGNIRLPHGGTIYGRNSANSSNIELFNWGGTTDTLVVGNASTTTILASGGSSNPITFQCAGSTRAQILPASMTFSGGCTSILFPTPNIDVEIKIPNTSLGGSAIKRLIVAGNDTSNTGGVVAGSLQLRAGNAIGASGSRTGGDVEILVGTGATANGNISLGAVASSYQSMQGGLYIGNASAVPSGNPASGGFLYVEAGALKWRGPSGAITAIGAA